jgi:Ser/Thr protein kinase RdoA (MazF antagonist)
MEKLIQTITQEYGLEGNVDSQLAPGGHYGENYVLYTNNVKYFLKQYKNTTEDRVIDIHKAYDFYKENGIPVIVPLFTISSEDYIMHNETPYAIFPYIDGIAKVTKDVTSHNCYYMGGLLAKMHKATKGSQNELVSYKKTRKHDEDHITHDLKKLSEIKEHIMDQDKLGEIDDMNLENINLKVNIIEKERENILNTFAPDDFILCHRDFHERNMFFDSEGNVTHIFDLDKCGADSISIEISRTIIYVCTAGKYEEINFDNIRALLGGYSKEFKIDKQNLKTGLRYFIYNETFSDWIMRQYYIMDNKRTKDFMHSQYGFQKYMYENIDYFIEKVLYYI